MLGKILFWCVGTVLLCGCRFNEPEIKSVCLRDGVGNYQIKWEINPEIKGTLAMYVSDSPEAFSGQSPVVYAPIHEGIATYITNDNVTRKYFRLLFNNEYSQVVGARSIVMDNVQNLRDLGGYSASDNRLTRWGKVFRSGQLSSLSQWDSIRLDKLGLKTIIDLRTEEEIALDPIRYDRARVVNIPISNTPMVDVPYRIKSGMMRQRDAVIRMQDFYLHILADQNREQLAHIFELMLDSDNYPILFNCTLGKDRTGMLAALLLTALDVPKEVIYSDYMLSNEFIDLSHFAHLASKLSTHAQESITVIVSADDDYLDLSFWKMKKDFGSVDKYLSKGLQLDAKKRKQLKDILLY